MSKPFKDLSIAPDVNSDPRLLSMVDASTRMLASVMGDSAGRVSVRWSRWGVGDLELAIEDDSGKVTTILTEQDVQRELRLHRKLFGIWGNLLQTKLDFLMRDFNSAEVASSAI